MLINNAGMMSEEKLESSQDLRFTADGLKVVTQHLSLITPSSVSFYVEGGGPF